jgi:glycogen debranching enzyme
MFRDWLYERFSEVKKLPNFLVPKYFNIVLMTAYHSAKEYCLSQMPEFVANGSQFVKQLALTSVQMYGSVPSTGLDVASRKASLAAGLPHFSTFHMRCWGRDVFIALRGLLLITGQFSAAKDHLLAFGGCELHGLIPNLLDSCRKPRFNARDAVWWYLQALQDYCQLAPDGLKLLQTKIKRRFPNDEYIDYQDPRAFGAEWTIAELVQHIMQQHANGIEFREWNAGSNLDHAMDSKGFDVRVRLDLETGFLHGGSQWNCGTWMDKMGDSSKAGNWGKPATPRDGAAIEIIGLLKSTLRWLTGLAEKGQLPTGVTIEGMVCRSKQLLCSSHSMIAW